MLRTTAVIFTCALMSINALAGETAHFYRSSDADQMSALGAAPEDFGLTPTQINQLHKLTDGKVDFRNFYRVDANNKSAEFNRFQSAGISDNTVPPPVIKSVDLDPELNGQWWIEDLNTAGVWDIATGAGITIADCDAGYYMDEPDLLPNLLVEERYDLADEDDRYSVQDGNFITHGTSVAAIILGVLDGSGTNGIAFDSKLVPLQNFNYDSSLDDLDKEVATAQCILKAIENPEVKIVVLENQTSQGSSETFEGTREAVELAMAAGVTIVSAGGNYSAELTIEAEHDTGSIIVGALDQSGDMAYFSNYGERITIAAFGEKLRTLRGPDGAMGDFGGTSGATPQVAATVALMLEVNPTLTPLQIRDLLVQTRVPQESTVRVGGRLDVMAAVQAALVSPKSTAKSNDQDDLRKRIVEILKQRG